MDRELNPVWYRATVRVPAVAEKRIVSRAGNLDEYAHVRVWVRPALKGSGNVLSWHAGSHIPHEFAGLVMEGTAAALRSGILGGIEFVDVSATIESGSYHEVDSTGEAFREAAEKATEKALRLANPVLLEAILSITISVPEEFTGVVQGAINSNDEIFQLMEADGRIVKLTANLAASRVQSFMTAVLQNTQGAARFSLSIANFVECAASGHAEDDWASLT